MAPHAWAVLCSTHYLSPCAFICCRTADKHFKPSSKCKHLGDFLVACMVCCRKVKWLELCFTHMAHPGGMGPEVLTDWLMDSNSSLGQEDQNHSQAQGEQQGQQGQAPAAAGRPGPSGASAPAAGSAGVVGAPLSELLVGVEEGMGNLLHGADMDGGEGGAAGGEAGEGGAGAHAAAGAAVAAAAAASAAAAAAVGDALLPEVAPAADAGAGAGPGAGGGAAAGVAEGVVEEVEEELEQVHCYCAPNRHEASARALQRLLATALGGASSAWDTGPSLELPQTHSAHMPEAMHGVEEAGCSSWMQALGSTCGGSSSSNWLRAVETAVLRLLPSLPGPLPLLQQLCPGLRRVELHRWVGCRGHACRALCAVAWGLRHPTQTRSNPRHAMHSYQLLCVPAGGPAMQWLQNRALGASPPCTVRSLPVQASGS